MNDRRISANRMVPIRVEDEEIVEKPPNNVKVNKREEQNKEKMDDAIFFSAEKIVFASDRPLAEGARISSNEPSPFVSHEHFAHRQPAGTHLPIAIGKRDTHLMRLLPSGESREILAVGLACSECFSGQRLAQLLKPGLEYEKQVIDNLMSGNFASPLSIHTSGGVPAALDGFIQALEPHLPWKEKDGDWVVSLQLEGASAVWAAVDMLLQLQGLAGNGDKMKVAVGQHSYHGPPSTSCGSKEPLWTKSYQVQYPVPTPDDHDYDKCVAAFSRFLDKHGEEVGVMLVEPQWGSSQAAYPWPQDLLKKYISMAREHDILICSDEIMCGLGRHGQGGLFLTKAWGLDTDAVTFGKAIAGGVFPLSGAILKRGAKALGQAGKTVIQSHTFAGSSVRALMAATEVLKLLPQWFKSIAKLGDEMKHIFRYLSAKSNGLLIAHGQGLMWGCLFSKEIMHRNVGSVKETMACFRKNCELVGVLPYYVPAGGFMVTPVMDIDVGSVYEIGEKLEEVLIKTMQDIGWKSGVGRVKESKVLEKTAARALTESPTTTALCTTHLHAARACTSCTNFVCRNVRMRFLCA